MKKSSLVPSFFHFEAHITTVAIHLKATASNSLNRCLLREQVRIIGSNDGIPL